MLNTKIPGKATAWLTRINKREIWLSIFFTFLRKMFSSCLMRHWNVLSDWSVYMHKTPTSQAQETTAIKACRWPVAYSGKQCDWLNAVHYGTVVSWTHYTQITLCRDVWQSILEPARLPLKWWSWLNFKFYTRKPKKLHKNHWQAHVISNITAIEKKSLVLLKESQSFLRII